MSDSRPVYRHTCRWRPAPMIHRKRDGLLLCRDDGSARFLTRWEAICFRLCGILPRDAFTLDALKE